MSNLRSRGRFALAIAVLGWTSISASAETISLRYGLAPGQRWVASQTLERTTHILGESMSDRGVARFRYEIETAPIDDHVSLVAKLLSQRTTSGESPFDFSQIRFLALANPRGTFRGVHFEIAKDVEPPDMPGLEKDPVAFREMLRRIAAAWSDAVFWLPELPEQALAIGESFTIGGRNDVGGSDPGVAMEIRSNQTYTLDRVEGRMAHFSIRVQSTVDAATAKSSVESEQRALGSGQFDLDLGMWTRQETRSEHRATFEGGPGGAGVATATTTTIVEMGPEQGP